jgi:hypothetical protein
MVLIQNDTDFPDGNLDHHLGHDFPVVRGDPDFLGNLADKNGAQLEILLAKLCVPKLRRC